MKTFIRLLQLSLIGLSLSLSLASTPHIREYNFGFEKGNLISNWSFENLGLNWDLESSQFTVNPRYPAGSICSSCRAVSGSFVGMVNGSYSSGGNKSHLVTQLFPVVPNQTYTLSYYYKTTSLTGTVEPRVFLYSSPDSGGSGTLQTVTGSSYQSSPGWSLYSTTFTSDSCSQYAKVSLLYSDVTGEGGTLYFDDVVLEEGNISPTGIASNRFQISEGVSFNDALGRTVQAQTKISSGAHNPYPQWKYVKPLVLNTTPIGANVSGPQFSTIGKTKQCEFQFRAIQGHRRGHSIFKGERGHASLRD